MKRYKVIGKLFAVLAVFSNFTVPTTHAVDSFTFSDLSALTNEATATLLKTFAYGADFRAYQPASSLGTSLGIDIGIEVTLIDISSGFTQILALIGNTSAFAATSVPLPRLVIHKGLPWGVDLGFSWIGFQGDSLLGFSGKWTFLNPGMASVAGRVSYTKADISFLETTTITIDVLASVKAFIIEPYVGLGLQLGSGSFDLTVNGAAIPAPAGVSTEASFSAMRFFIGVPVKLGFLHITGEYGKTFGAGSSLGGKLSLAF